MLICPKCKTENRPEAAFCVSCGAILFAVPTPTKATAPESEQAELVLPVQAPAEPVLTAPEPPAPIEPALFLSGFPRRPEGTIFGDRFRFESVIHHDDHEIRYTVHETNQPPAPCVRICSNPECQTIHSPMGSYLEKYCTRCGQLLAEQPPLLLLVESDTDRFKDLNAVIELNLAHPNIHPPITTFQEDLPGGVRYYLVSPYSQDMPTQADTSQALEWGLQLANALDYLHDHGVAFSEELNPTSFGLSGKKAIWRNFDSIRLLPMLTDRDKINNIRLLAVHLYTWITGKVEYTTDPFLPPALNLLFKKALLGEGFNSGASFAQQIQLTSSSGLSTLSLDYQAGLRTHPGLVRDKNEDSILSLTIVRGFQGVSQSVGLFAIADGMGGHATGDLASSLVIQTINHKVFSQLTTLQNLASQEYTSWLNQVVQAANLSVYEARQKEGNDMGSTLVCTMIIGSLAFLAHQGDSRIYLIREGAMQQLTTDHSLVQHLVNIGYITQEEARNHPQRNVIYRSLGDKPQADADLSFQQLLPGDKLLLCSDGLTGMLDNQAIQKIILEASSPQVACDRLIDAANLAGGEDNVSVILIDMSPK